MSPSSYVIKRKGERVDVRTVKKLLLRYRQLVKGISF